MIPHERDSFESTLKKFNLHRRPSDEHVDNLDSCTGATFMFKKASDIHQGTINVAVYGAAGVGKTSLTKTIPGKKVLVSLENGCLSIAGDETIDIYDCCVDGHGNELDRTRRIEKFSYFFKEILPKHTEYDWVVVDSLTELAQVLVEHLKKKYPDRSDAFPMWGEYNDCLLAISKTLRDCGRNVYITALDSVDKDDSGKRFIGIDVAGKISSRIPAFYDEVFYLKEFTEEGKSVRKLITGPWNGVVAKDRSGKLNLVEDADLTSVIKKIKGN